MLFEYTGRDVWDRGGQYSEPCRCLGADGCGAGALPCRLLAHCLLARRLSCSIFLPRRQGELCKGYEGPLNVTCNVTGETTRSRERQKPLKVQRSGSSVKCYLFWKKAGTQDSSRNQKIPCVTWRQLLSLSISSSAWPGKLNSTLRPGGETVR